MTTDVNILTAAVFEIRELTGLERFVTLAGRALPYRPFSLEGNQRVEITWNPGNPEGTGTVLGASEGTTSINGFWKEMYLSGPNVGNTAPFVVNGDQITTTMAAVKLMDDIRRQGQEIEVTWNEITRRGYLTKFRQEWHNLKDCAWTMEFEWISLGEHTAPAVLDQVNSAADTSALMTGQNNELQNAAMKAPMPVPQKFNTELLEGLASIADAVKDAANAVAVQYTGVTTPPDSARRVFAATNNVVATAGGVAATFDAQPPRALVSGGDPAVGSIAALPLGKVVAAEAYAATSRRAARTLARTAAARRAALARTLQSQLIGVYAAREGDDLRTVAERFYGSRLQWRPLLVFNELSGTRLSRGQLVLVPRLTSGAT